MVAPFMVLLLSGIFEFGTLFRNETIVANAVRQAARVESQAGDEAGNATVDLSAIQTFMAATNGLTNMTIQRLVIYDAPSGGVAPTNCRTATFTDDENPHGRGSASPTAPTAGTNCNVYLPNQIKDAQRGTLNSGSSVSSKFGCTGSTSWDRYYCVTLRSNTVGGTVDKVGVWVQYTYKDVTSLLGNTMTVTDYAAFAVQPNV